MKDTDISSFLSTDQTLNETYNQTLNETFNQPNNDISETPDSIYLNNIYDLISDLHTRVSTLQSTATIHESINFHHTNLYTLLSSARYEEAREYLRAICGTSVSKKTSKSQLLNLTKNVKKEIEILYEKLNTVRGMAIVKLTDHKIATEECLRLDGKLENYINFIKEINYLFSLDPDCINHENNSVENNHANTIYKTINDKDKGDFDYENKSNKYTINENKINNYNFVENINEMKNNNIELLESLKLEENNGNKDKSMNLQNINLEDKNNFEENTTFYNYEIINSENFKENTNDHKIDLNNNKNNIKNDVQKIENDCNFAHKKNISNDKNFLYDLKNKIKNYIQKNNNLNSQIKELKNEIKKEKNSKNELSNKNLQEENILLQENLNKLTEKNIKLKKENVILSNELMLQKEGNRKRQNALEKQKKIIEILQNKFGKEKNNSGFIDEIKTKINIIKNEVENEINYDEKNRKIGELIDYEKRLMDYLKVVKRNAS